MRQCLNRAYQGALPRVVLAAVVTLALLIGGIASGETILLFGVFAAAMALGLFNVSIRAYRLWRAQQEPGLLRVEGPIAARERTHGSGRKRTTTYHVTLANGDEMSVDEAVYTEIMVAGELVQGNQSSLWRFVGDMSGAYEVRSAVTTYSETGRLILDIRRSDGTAIYCHPEYDGEGWDR